MARGYDVSAWNDAQKYVSEIIHPLMQDHIRYAQITLYGSPTLEESRRLSPKQRDIEKFNGLKGMIGTILLICDEITSTVSLKKKKSETDMLEKISDKLNEIITFMENEPDYFFEETEHGLVLDKARTWEFRVYAVKCYKNINKIMTLNNLLFKGDFEEVTQEEILAQLEKEVLEA